MWFTSLPGTEPPESPFIFHTFSLGDARHYPTVSSKLHTQGNEMEGTYCWRTQKRTHFPPSLIRIVFTHKIIKNVLLAIQHPLSIWIRQHFLVEMNSDNKTCIITAAQNVFLRFAWKIHEEQTYLKQNHSLLQMHCRWFCNHPVFFSLQRQNGI